MRLNSFTFWLRVYTLAALMAAAAVAPLLLLPLPLLLALAYAAVWRWPLSRTLTLLADYSIFFTLPLLYEPAMGPWCLLPALPLLGLLLADLRRQESRPRQPVGRDVRRPAPVTLALLLTAVGAVAVSQVLSSLALLLSGSLVLLVLLVLLWDAHRRLPRQPFTAPPQEQRILVGTREVYPLQLPLEHPPGGSVTLRPVASWVRLWRGPYSLAAPEVSLRVRVKPETAGPQDVVLRGVAVDRWGLLCQEFQCVPLSLNVIPRARYAAWLARRFLAQTAAGEMPYVAEIPNTTARFVLAQGMEYFYSRIYQPGDSLHRIDWKHTNKYDELITKNFVEISGQQALLLVNLTAADNTELDDIAYKVLMTALSLAREDIPARLAAYDRTGVRLTTRPIAARRLVLQALRLVRELAVAAPPRRYLAPPQPARLQSNLRRLRENPATAGRVLGELVGWELESLKRRAAASPVTEALRQTGVPRFSEYTLMLVSGLNHDADAIAYHSYRLQNQGVKVITV